MTHVFGHHPGDRALLHRTEGMTVTDAPSKHACGVGVKVEQRGSRRDNSLCAADGDCIDNYTLPVTTGKVQAQYMSSSHFSALPPLPGQSSINVRTALKVPNPSSSMQFIEIPFKVQWWVVAPTVFVSCHHL